MPLSARCGHCEAVKVKENSAFKYEPFVAEKHQQPPKQGLSYAIAVNYRRRSLRIHEVTFGQSIEITQQTVSSKTMADNTHRWLVIVRHPAPPSQQRHRRSSDLHRQEAPPLCLLLVAETPNSPYHVLSRTLVHLGDASRSPKQTTIPHSRGIPCQ